MGHGEPLFKDEQHKRRLESENELLSADEAARLARELGQDFVLTPEIIKHFHSIVVKGIYSCAGQFRTWSVSITGSTHRPPRAHFVEGLVANLCDHVNAYDKSNLVEVAAYILWRLNWIHPFGGGNGRTSRAITYLAVSAWFGFELPGKQTVLELIVSERRRYTEALRDADAALESLGVTDVSKMTILLDELLTRQLAFLNELPPTDAQD